MEFNFRIEVVEICIMNVNVFVDVLKNVLEEYKRKFIEFIRAV